MPSWRYAGGWPTHWAQEGRLPARYGEVWGDEFDEIVRAVMRPHMQILDVGSGREPTIRPECRPPGTRYVGLDLSATELARAPAGSYDEIRVGDAAERASDFDDRFDLVVSWQVFEHIRALEDAFDNVRCYLRAGGQLVVLLSGGLSAIALLNRLVPHRAAQWAMQRLIGRSPDTVFPAYYDRCRASTMRRMLADWTSVDIRSKYTGASYFSFAQPLMRAYLSYEDLAASRGFADLATHYLVSAEL